jgi:hypothetical protein
MILKLIYWQITINMKAFLYLFLLIASINLPAAILDNEEAADAEINTLQAEAALFKTIGASIALSLAQCEGVDLCTVNVEEVELKELLKVLSQRINDLTLKQEEVIDPDEFQQVLTTYVNEYDSYSSHLEKLNAINGAIYEGEDSVADEFQFEIEADFPVETATNEALPSYLDELAAFEDEEILDDEDLGDLPDLPELE